MVEAGSLFAKAAALALILLLAVATSCETLPAPGLDSDGDGWPDAQEKLVGSSPNKVDTDGDGYWDPHDPNPLDPNIPAVTGTPAPTPTPTPEPTPTPVPPATLERGDRQELEMVRAAVRLMMSKNGLAQIPNPVTVPTSDMHAFPDATTHHGEVGVGYVLYLHDSDGDGDSDINYIRLRETRGTYICDRDGTVTQVQFPGLPAS